ncbi:MAG: aminotransferase class III-fold pyridoxal phosphate-dependent enzyme, partial [Chloroflexi bacterium]
AFEVRTPALTNAVMQQAFRRGLLVLPTGARAIRLSPALTVSSDEIAVALEILDASCAAAAAA